MDDSTDQRATGQIFAPVQVKQVVHIFVTDELIQSGDRLPERCRFYQQSLSPCPYNLAFPVQDRTCELQHRNRIVE